MTRLSSAPHLIDRGTMELIRVVFKIPHWHERAACRKIDNPHDLFLSTKTNGAISKKAKAICNDKCPVKKECLAWVLELEKHGPVFGIYAGTNHSDRIKIKLCKVPGCTKKALTNRLPYCSKEHQRAHKNQIHYGKPKQEYYKQGTINGYRTEKSYS